MYDLQSFTMHCGAGVVRRGTPIPPVDLYTTSSGRDAWRSDLVSHLVVAAIGPTRMLPYARTVKPLGLRPQPQWFAFQKGIEPWLLVGDIP